MTPRGVQPQPASTLRRGLQHRQRRAPGRRRDCGAPAPACATAPAAHGILQLTWDGSGSARRQMRQQRGRGVAGGRKLLDGVVVSSARCAAAGATPRANSSAILARQPPLPASFGSAAARPTRSRVQHRGALPGRRHEGAHRVAPPHASPTAALRRLWQRQQVCPACRAASRARLWPRCQHWPTCTSMSGVFALQHRSACGSRCASAPVRRADAHAPALRLCHLAAPGRARRPVPAGPGSIHQRLAHGGGLTCRRPRKPHAPRRDSSSPRAA